MRNLPLRAEDLLLGVVNLAAPSLALPRLGGGDAANPLLGVAIVLALAAAVLAVGLRPSGQPALQAGNLAAPRTALVGPLLGGLFFVGALGGEQLGMADGSVIGGLACLAAMAAVAVTHWLPTASPQLRRALVAPFVLVCAGIFQGFALDIVGSLDVAAMVREAPAVGMGFASFVAVLLLGGVGVYYAMLVVAPRELADPEGRAWLWIPRFVVFLITAVLGLGIVLV